MKYFGIHVESGSDLSAAPAMAVAVGANAFALNLADPAKWRSPAIADDVAASFRAECARLGFGPDQILPHAGFVINPGSPDARKLKLSQMALIDEMQRAHLLGLDRLNFHPGAHLRQIDPAECIRRISTSINIALRETEGVTAVIENTAGQGSNLGWSLQQIADMIAGVDDRSRVGVCIDTAHAYAAGYDVATPEGFAAMWDEFERLIGFGYLRGMHLNDSQRPLGSRIDRHAPLGQGTIGFDCFDAIAADPRFDGIPLILETPDPLLWPSEIARLRAAASLPPSLT